MPKRIHVEVGTKFNRLTYLGDCAQRNNMRRALFACDCGMTTEKQLSDVRSGHTTSCGCFHTERIRSGRTHGATVGRKSTPEYRTWKAIKGRCLDVNNKAYFNYGGRGISICERWLNSYENFLADVGKKPSNLHSIDRINNDGNYEPGNVRWATASEQRRNSRATLHPVTINGETKLICEWAVVSGVPEESISSRIRKGWDKERAIFTPITRAKQIHRSSEHKSVRASGEAA